MLLFFFWNLHYVSLSLFHFLLSSFSLSSPFFVDADLVMHVLEDRDLLVMQQLSVEITQLI